MSKFYRSQDVFFEDEDKIGAWVAALRDAQDAGLLITTSASQTKDANVFYEIPNGEAEDFSNIMITAPTDAIATGPHADDLSGYLIDTAHIVAPGKWLIRSNGVMTERTGSSFATALVAETALRIFDEAENHSRHPYNPTPEEVKYILLATTHPAKQSGGLGSLNPEYALAITRAALADYFEDGDTLKTAVDKALTGGVKPLGKTGQVEFDVAYGYRETAEGLKIVKIGNSIIDDLPDIVVEVAFFRGDKLVAKLTGDEYRKALANDELKITIPVGGTEDNPASYTAKFDIGEDVAGQETSGQPNALAFEVGTNAREERPVVVLNRTEDGEWTNDFVHIRDPQNSDQEILALRAAYGEQYFEALRSKFDQLKSEGTVEQAIDVVDRLFSRITHPVRVVFDSGQKQVANSYLEVDGETVVLVLNPLVVFNSELLAFTIAHELVGHWFLQYLDADGIPTMFEDAGLVAEFNAFKQRIGKEGNLRVFAEVFAHIVSGRLFHGLTPGSKAATLGGLENAADISFLDNTVRFLNDTYGTERDTQKILEGTVAFVQQNYFQDDSDPDKASIEEMLSKLQSNPAQWAETVEIGELLLGRLMGSVINIRGSPVADGTIQLEEGDRTPAAYLLRHFLLALGEGNGMTAEAGAQALLQDLIERTVNAAIQQQVSFAQIFGTEGPIDTSQPLAKLRELDQNGTLQRAVAADLVSQSRIDSLFDRRFVAGNAVQVSENIHQLWGSSKPEASILLAGAFSNFPDIQSDAPITIHGALNPMERNGEMSATIVRQQLEWESATGRDNRDISILARKTPPLGIDTDVGALLKALTDTIDEAVFLRRQHDRNETGGQPIRVINFSDGFRLTALERANFRAEIALLELAVKDAQTAGILIVAGSSDTQGEDFLNGLAQKHSNIYVVASIKSLVSNPSREVWKRDDVDPAHLLAPGLLLMPPYDNNVTSRLSSDVASARVSVAAALVSREATEVVREKYQQLHVPTPNDVVAVLQATAHSSDNGARKGVLHLEGALALTRAALDDFDSKTDSLEQAIVSIDTDKVSPLPRIGTLQFDKVIRRGSNQRGVISIAELIEFPTDSGTGFSENEDEFALIYKGKMVGVFDAFEYRVGVREGRIHVSEDNGIGTIDFNIDFDFDKRAKVITNALAFEVGSNARDGRPVVEWSRTEDGEWSNQFFELPASEDLSKTVPALRVAYDDQYFEAIQAQFNTLAAKRTIETAVDAVDAMFSHIPRPVRVIFDSGQKRLADSRLSDDGTGTVILVLNPLVAFNSELLAFTIAHELIGHWLLQYFSTDDIPAADLDPELAKDLDAFKKDIAKFGWNMRVFAEVYAHMVSGQLFQQTFSPGSKAELLRGLENAPNIAFLDNVLRFLHDTFGAEHAFQPVVLSTIEFVKQNYFQDDSDPDKASIDKSLASMTDFWLAAGERLNEANSLLERLLRSVIQTRGSPQIETLLSSAGQDNTPAGYLVQHYLPRAEDLFDSSLVSSQDSVGVTQGESAQTLLQDLIERTVNASIQHTVSFASIFGTEGPIDTKEPLSKLQELFQNGALDRAIGAGLVSPQRVYTVLDLQFLAEPFAVNAQKSIFRLWGPEDASVSMLVVDHFESDRFPDVRFDRVPDIRSDVQDPESHGGVVAVVARRHIEHSDSYLGGSGKSSILASAISRDSSELDQATGILRNAIALRKSGHSIRVISLSLIMPLTREDFVEFESRIAAFNEAVRDANDAGILVIGGAGDKENLQSAHYHLLSSEVHNLPAVIIVGSTDAIASGLHADIDPESFLNHASLVAPGKSLIKTSKFDVDTYLGSSGATPQVAGTALWIFEEAENHPQHPYNPTPEEVKYVLLKSLHPPKQSGGLGSLNPEYAIGLVRGALSNHFGAGDTLLTAVDKALAEGNVKPLRKTGVVEFHNAFGYREGSKSQKLELIKGGEILNLPKDVTELALFRGNRQVAVFSGEEYRNAQKSGQLQVTRSQGTKGQPVVYTARFDIGEDSATDEQGNEAQQNAIAIADGCICRQSGEPVEAAQATVKDGHLVFHPLNNTPAFLEGHSPVDLRGIVPAALLNDIAEAGVVFTIFAGGVTQVGTSPETNSRAREFLDVLGMEHRLTSYYHKAEGKGFFTVYVPHRDIFLPFTDDSVRAYGSQVLIELATNMKRLAVGIDPQTFTLYRTNEHGEKVAVSSPDSADRQVLEGALYSKSLERVIAFATETERQRYLQVSRYLSEYKRIQPYELTPAQLHEDLSRMGNAGQFALDVDMVWSEMFAVESTGNRASTIHVRAKTTEFKADHVTRLEALASHIVPEGETIEIYFAGEDTPTFRYQNLASDRGLRRVRTELLPYETQALQDLGYRVIQVQDGKALVKTDEGEQILDGVWNLWDIGNGRILASRSFSDSAQQAIKHLALFAPTQTRNPLLIPAVFSEGKLVRVAVAAARNELFSHNKSIFDLTFDDVQAFREHAEEAFAWSSDVINEIGNFFSKPTENVLLETANHLEKVVNELKELNAVSESVVYSFSLDAGNDALSIEIATRPGIKKQLVVAETRQDSEGKWTHQKDGVESVFLYQEVEGETVSNMELAFDEPGPIAEELQGVIQSGFPDKMVEVVESLLGRDKQVVLRYVSGHPVLADSRVEGDAVVINRDAQAAQNEATGGLLLTHELVGHMLQRRDPSTLSDGLGSRLSAFRDSMSSLGAERQRILYEMIALSDSVDLLIDGYSPALRAAFYAGLESGEANGLDPFQQALEFFGTVGTIGKHLSPEEKIRAIASYMRQAYYRGDGNRDGLLNVLDTDVMEDVRTWSGLVTQGQELLAAIVVENSDAEALEAVRKSIVDTVKSSPFEQSMTMGAVLLHYAKLAGASKPELADQAEQLETFEAPVENALIALYRDIRRRAEENNKVRVVFGTSKLPPEVRFYQMAQEVRRWQQRGILAKAIEQGLVSAYRVRELLDEAPSAVDSNWTRTKSNRWIQVQGANDNAGSLSVRRLFSDGSMQTIGTAIIAGDIATLQLPSVAAEDISEVVELVLQSVNERADAGELGSIEQVVVSDSGVSLEALRSSLEKFGLTVKAETGAAIIFTYQRPETSSEETTEFVEFDAEAANPIRKFYASRPNGSFDMPMNKFRQMHAKELLAIYGESASRQKQEVKKLLAGLEDTSTYHRVQFVPESEWLADPSLSNSQYVSFRPEEITRWRIRLPGPSWDEEEVDNLLNYQLSEILSARVRAYVTRDSGESNGPVRVSAFRYSREITEEMYRAIGKEEFYEEDRKALVGMPRYVFRTLNTPAQVRAFAAYSTLWGNPAAPTSFSRSGEEIRIGTEEEDIILDISEANEKLRKQVTAQITTDLQTTTETWTQAGVADANKKAREEVISRVVPVVLQAVADSPITEAENIEVDGLLVAVHGALMSNEEAAMQRAFQRAVKADLVEIRTGCRSNCGTEALRIVFRNNSPEVQGSIVDTVVRTVSFAVDASLYGSLDVIAAEEGRKGNQVTLGGQTLHSMLGGQVYDLKGMEPSAVFATIARTVVGTVEGASTTRSVVVAMEGKDGGIGHTMTLTWRPDQSETIIIEEKGREPREVAATTDGLQSDYQDRHSGKFQYPRYLYTTGPPIELPKPTAADIENYRCACALPGKSTRLPEEQPSEEEVAVEDEIAIEDGCICRGSGEPVHAVIATVKDGQLVFRPISDSTPPTDSYLPVDLSEIVPSELLNNVAQSGAEFLIGSGGVQEVNTPLTARSHARAFLEALGMEHRLTSFLHRGSGDAGGASLYVPYKGAFLPLADTDARAYSARVVAELTTEAKSLVVNVNQQTFTLYRTNELGQQVSISSVDSEDKQAFENALYSETSKEVIVFATNSEKRRYLQLAELVDSHILLMRVKLLGAQWDKDRTLLEQAGNLPKPNDIRRSEKFTVEAVGNRVSTIHVRVNTTEFDARDVEMLEALASHVVPEGETIEIYFAGEDTPTLRYQNLASDRGLRRVRTELLPYEAQVLLDLGYLVLQVKDGKAIVKTGTEEQILEGVWYLWDIGNGRLLASRSFSDFLQHSIKRLALFAPTQTKNPLIFPALFSEGKLTHVAVREKLEQLDESVLGTFEDAHVFRDLAKEVFINPFVEIENHFGKPIENVLLETANHLEKVVNELKELNAVSESVVYSFSLDAGNDALSIEIGGRPGIRKQLVVAETRQDSEGKWTHQKDGVESVFLSQEVEGETVSNMELAFDNPGPIAEELQGVIQSGFPDKMVEVVESLLGRDRQVVLRYVSGHPVLADSRVEGDAVVINRDAQAAQNEATGGLLLTHELVGHMLQRRDPSTLSDELGSRLSAFRDSMSSLGAERQRILYEMIALSDSVDLLIDGYSPALRAAFYAGLEGAESNGLDPFQQALQFFGTVGTVGKHLSPEEKVRAIALYMRQAYYRGDSQRDELRHVLETDVLEDLRTWSGLVSQGQELLAAMVAEKSDAEALEAIRKRLVLHTSIYEVVESTLFAQAEVMNAVLLHYAKVGSAGLVKVEGGIATENGSVENGLIALYEDIRRRALEQDKVEEVFGTEELSDELYRGQAAQEVRRWQQAGILAKAVQAQLVSAYRVGELFGDAESADESNWTRTKSNRWIQVQAAKDNASSLTVNRLFSDGSMLKIGTAIIAGDIATLQLPSVAAEDISEVVELVLQSVNERADAGELGSIDQVVVSDSGVSLEALRSSLEKFGLTVKAETGAAIIFTYQRPETSSEETTEFVEFDAEAANPIRKFYASRPNGSFDMPMNKFRQMYSKELLATYGETASFQKQEVEKLLAGLEDTSTYHRVQFVPESEWLSDPTLSNSQYVSFRPEEITRWRIRLPGPSWDVEEVENLLNYQLAEILSARARAYVTRDSGESNGPVRVSAFRYSREITEEMYRAIGKEEFYEEDRKALVGMPYYVFRTLNTPAQVRAFAAYSTLWANPSAPTSFSRSGEEIRIGTEEEDIILDISEANEKLRKKVTEQIRTDLERTTETWTQAGVANANKKAREEVISRVVPVVLQAVADSPITEAENIEVDGLLVAVHGALMSNEEAAMQRAFQRAVKADLVEIRTGCRSNCGTEALRIVFRNHSPEVQGSIVDTVVRTVSFAVDAALYGSLDVIASEEGRKGNQVTLGGQTLHSMLGGQVYDLKGMDPSTAFATIARSVVGTVEGASTTRSVVVAMEGKQGGIGHTMTLTWRPDQSDTITIEEKGRAPREIAATTDGLQSDYQDRHSGKFQYPRYLYTTGPPIELPKATAADIENYRCACGFRTVPKSYRGNKEPSPSQVRKLAESVTRFYVVENPADNKQYWGDAESQVIARYYTPEQLRDRGIEPNDVAAMEQNNFAVNGDRTQMTARFVVTGSDTFPWLALAQKAAVKTFTLFPSNKEIWVQSSGRQKVRFTKANQPQAPPALDVESLFTYSEPPLVADLEQITKDGTRLVTVVEATIGNDTRYAVINTSDVDALQQVAGIEAKPVVTANFMQRATGPASSLLLIDEAWGRSKTLQQQKTLRFVGTGQLDVTLKESIDGKGMLDGVADIAASGRDVTTLTDSELEFARQANRNMVVVQPNVGGVSRIMPLDVLARANPADYDIVRIVPNYTGVNTKSNAAVHKHQQDLVKRTANLTQAPRGETFSVAVSNPSGGTQTLHGIVIPTQDTNTVVREDDSTLDLSDHENMQKWLKKIPYETIGYVHSDGRFYDTSYEFSKQPQFAIVKAKVERFADGRVVRPKGVREVHRAQKDAHRLTTGMPIVDQSLPSLEWVHGEDNQFSWLTEAARIFTIGNAETLDHLLEGDTRFHGDDEYYIGDQPVAAGTLVARAKALNSSEDKLADNIGLVSATIEPEGQRPLHFVFVVLRDQGESISENVYLQLLERLQRYGVPFRIDHFVSNSISDQDVEDLKQRSGQSEIATTDITVARENDGFIEPDQSRKITFEHMQEAMKYPAYTYKVAGFVEENGAVRGNGLHLLQEALSEDKDVEYREPLTVDRYKDVTFVAALEPTEDDIEEVFGNKDVSTVDTIHKIQQQLGQKTTGLPVMKSSLLDVQWASGEVNDHSLLLHALRIYANDDNAFRHGLGASGPGEYYLDTKPINKRLAMDEAQKLSIGLVFVDIAPERPENSIWSLPSRKARASKAMPTLSFWTRSSSGRSRFKLSTLSLAKCPNRISKPFANYRDKTKC